MTALTTVPSMPKLAGLKEIFDPDLILGLGLAVALDFTLGYVAIKLYPPLTGRLGVAPWDIAYDDLLMLGIEIAGVLLMKGRLRKIFIYALWFSIFHRLAFKLQRITGLGFL